MNNMKQNLNIKSKKLKFLLKEISLQIKQNPNNFIIIKKWNKIIFDKYKYELYSALEEEIELQFHRYLLFNNYLFDNYIDVRSI